MAGIVGIYSFKDAIKKAYYCLLNTQTRGQENCGISAAGDKSIRTYNGKRLISGVFHEDILKAFVHPEDYAVVAHVGDKKVERIDIAPLELDFENYTISVAMDGLILNHSEVDKKFKFKTNTDEELFGKVFNEFHRGGNIANVDKAIQNTMETLNKAYFSTVILYHDKKQNYSNIIGVRSNNGIKPMYIGKNNTTVAITSESGAIDNLQLFEDDLFEGRDVKPGEMIESGPLEMGIITTTQVLKPKPKYCAFEWIYTARPDAIIEGKTSHIVRKKCGHNLVKTYGIKYEEDTVVFGTPDSGRSVALGFAEASKLPFDEGIIKNQYIGRSYIVDDPEERYMAAMLKHNAIKEIVKDKKVIIGDDSIVRGTISDSLAKVLKDAGAKEVDLAISYAPIFYSCFVDESNKKLAAKGMENLDVFEIGRKVAEKLSTIDSVMYNSIEGVVDAIGLPREQLCTRCITGKDPFK